MHSNNNNLKIKLPLLFALTLAVGMFFGTMLQKNLQPASTSKQNKIEELLNLVKGNYVDNINADSIFNSVNNNASKLKDSIEDKVIIDFLDKLDPHSIYLPPVQLKQSNEEMKGEFAGIGVEYSIINDTIYTTYIVPDGPAEKAKLQIGSKIIKVNDSIVAGVHINTTRLRKLLRGEMNSLVTLNVINENNSNANVIIKRGMVNLSSIDAAYMINSTIGYIKLNKFSLTSYAELRKALVELKNSGMKSLIFDLRGNGGGSLNDAVNIVDEFVGGKQLITYTEGSKVKRQEYYTNFEGQFETGKLILLIDEFSASASEVVAGALQDLDRAIIVGRRSFGKGLVQRQFGFTDNSAVRITVARYYTPSGRSIQKPYTNGKEDYEKDLMNRMTHNGLTVADSNKLENSKQYKTKNGKIVYGGGGITPDYFIALDTSIKYFEIMNKLYDKNTLLNYAFHFYLKNKEDLKKYTNIENFSKSFTMNNLQWLDFNEFCKKDNIDLANISTPQKNYIQEKLTQLIARQLWRKNGYYEVINLNDPTIQKAISLLHN